MKSKTIVLMISCIVIIFFCSFIIYSIYLDRKSEKQAVAVKAEEVRAQEAINAAKEKDEQAKKADENNKKELAEKQKNEDEKNKLKVSEVKVNTIKVITSVHNELNSAVSGTNKPTTETYKKAKIYGEQLKKEINNETWDYIIFDLKRAVLNLEYANKTNDKQCLLIAHRILHDLDVHIFNISDENSKKESFAVSQTYRLMHRLPSYIPSELPPPGA